MKVTSKLLYKELRVALNPLMKKIGFTSVKADALTWTRQTPEGNLTLWFQCDKWGWDERWGARFTMQFQVAPLPMAAMVPDGRFDRIGFVLEGFKELDELRIANNAVIERLPGTLANQVVVGQLEDGTEYVAEGYRTDPEPAIYGRDIWLHYYSLDDVRNWATYFEGKLEHFIGLFQRDKRSPEGMARQRFDQQMSLVQSTRGRHEKAKILEKFIIDEPDQNYRSSAQRWLSLLSENPESPPGFT